MMKKGAKVMWKFKNLPFIGTIVDFYKFKTQSRYRERGKCALLIRQTNGKLVLKLESQVQLVQH